MEEDYKNIEKMIKRLDKYGFNIYRNSSYVEDYLGTITGKDILAIENLLLGYKQLEEENKTLRRANSITKDISIEDITQVMNKAYKDFMKEFIPTSLVKEKIEDLERRGYFEGADAMKDLLERSGEDEKKYSY